ncbi:glycosyltransferase family 4 protein [Larkinella insperata]|uniref:Glycosyltransferase family 4 protein n=1 Tax=Larkinella insperata TaxID=332158 RepID=A0ABW3Q2M6_9BACT|nr:glycosyltransferase family 4 protein [Larkinella insperata]
MKQARKILFLTQLPPPIHGASKINEYIKTSIPINEKFDTNYINIITAKDLDDVQKFSWSKIAVIAKLYLKIIKSCFQVKYDLVFVTLSTDGIAFYKSALVWIMAATFIKRRMIMLHEKGIETTARKNAFNRLITRRMINSSDLIVTSKLLLQEFAGYTAKKYVVCSGTPGTSRIKDASFPAENGPKLLYLSNLIVEKGILVFIDICAELSRRGFYYQAVIVGKESDIAIEELQQLIREKNINDRVTLAGPKYNEEKEAYLLASDFLVFPTFYKRETTPLVIQEAFKFGLVPISSPEGGIPDLIEDGIDGFVIDPEDVQQYCDRIMELSANHDRLKAFRKAGQAKFDNRFSLPVFENNMVSVLEAALN